MAVENLSAITEAPLASGRDSRTPAAVVQDGSMAAQRTVDGQLGDDRREAAASRNQAARHRGR